MWSVRASFFDHLRASVAGERRPSERDDFSSNRHPALSFCLSMISAQTLRVCREGKPVPTPHQVRGRLFPDHALVLTMLDSSLRDVKQDDSNNEVAPSRSGEQIDDVLDGVVGAVVGGFESAVWAMLRVRTAVEAAVGKWSAQPFVEEQK